MEEGMAKKTAQGRQFLNAQPHRMQQNPNLQRLYVEGIVRERLRGLVQPRFHFSRTGRNDGDSTPAQLTNLVENIGFDR
jgi:hypothetical protein